MKQILLLTTGGTIASVESEHGLIPGMDSAALLSDVPEISNLCQLTTRAILNLDSSNLQPKDWQIIANEVFASLSDYDGIVITHGTDTMAYTASALFYMLKGLHKPVILTGSQLPMKSPGTDAKKNLIDAIRTAITGRPGIFVVFHSRILDGPKVSKIDSFDFNAYDAVDKSPDLGVIQDGQVLFSSPDFQKPSSSCVLSDQLCNNVVIFQIFPGFSKDFLIQSIDAGVQGIILRGYGSGNVPGKGNSLLPALHYAKEKRIPVILGTQCTYGGCSSTYETGSLALDAGALSAGSLSIEHALVRLMYLLGQTKDYDQICRFWEQY